MVNTKGINHNLRLREVKKGGRFGRLLIWKCWVKQMEEEPLPIKNVLRSEEVVNYRCKAFNLENTVTCVRSHNGKYLRRMIFIIQSFTKRNLF